MAESLKVRQAIKRKFPVIDIDDSLDMAIQLMAETNVSVLAVKVGAELIGIVSVWDVMNGLAHDFDRQQTKISTFMTKCEFNTDKSSKNACIQLDEDEDVISAIKVMSAGDRRKGQTCGDCLKPGTDQTRRHPVKCSGLS